MSETQRTINAWQRETFGETHPWAAFERMQKEYWELRDAVHKIGGPEGRGFCERGDLEKARGEVADVFITLCRVAEELGCDMQDEVDRKMAINRERKWVVDGTGNGQHV